MIGVGIVSAVGGAGRTSVALNLASMLANLGRKVVLIEMDPANLLSFQLGKPDWAKAGLYQVLTGAMDWPATQQAVADNLDFIPFGPASYQQSDELGLRLRKDPTLVSDKINTAGWDEDTILIFDTPRLPSSWASASMRLTDLNLVLLAPDAQSLLSVDLLVPAMLEGRGASYFLMNRFHSTHVLHLDIWTMAKIKLSHRLLPFYMHEDQALPEAFASGEMLQEYASSSHLTDDLQKLANWIDLELE